MGAGIHFNLPSSDTLWHKIILMIFAIFPTICKNLLTFSNLNSLHKNTVPRNHVCSITICLFHLETKQYTYTLFDGLAYNTCGYFASCVVFF